MYDFKGRYQEVNKLMERYLEIAAHIRELTVEVEQYKKQKEELFSRFGKRYGQIHTSESQNYTEEELTNMRMQLANSAGLWALIKSMLGFGKSQRDIYYELMGKLNGLLNYMGDRIQESQGEGAAIVNKLYQISDEYSLAYKNIKCYSGCNEDADWSNYEMPETLENEKIFLGDLLKPLPLENMREGLGENAEHDALFSKCREKSALNIPTGFKLTQPVQICVDYQSKTAANAREILQSVVYQVVRNIPQYYIEFHFMDAVTSGDDFKDFIRLQQVKKTDVVMLNRKVTGGNYQLVHSYLKSEDISRGLSELMERMTRIINEKAPYATVSEYNAQQGMDAWIPYQLIIAQNLQEGYSENDIKTLQYFIENGRSLGVFVLIFNNKDRWNTGNSYGKKTGIEEYFSAEIMQNMLHVSMDAEKSDVSIKGLKNEFRHWYTGGSHQDYIEKIVAVMGSEKKLDNEFQRIFDMNEPFGKMDSTNGLTIPFAINQRGELISYTLGQALNAHGLICGGTGSGKSSLLHMLISSIVMNYTPDDVELWVIDYKITEFYSYKTNTPPHIRFIGLSKTSDFSYAFLDKIVAEMNRRQDLIAQADHQYKLGGGKNNITSFADYRKVNGKNSMRRLLIIIDEFHVMSQHAQLEPDYKTKLENILSEARALGIIILLSDQAIVDGLRGLSDKGKKQIKARIALSNYKDEIKETLNEDDMDKIRSLIHMNVGEVAIQTMRENEDREEVPMLERATAIYINGTCRYNLNERAREIYGATDYTADVFDDRIVEPMKLEEINHWEEENLEPRRDGTKDLYIYLGRPVNLEPVLGFPLLQRKGNNMMCVSGTEEQQMRILQSIISSFLRQTDFEIRVLADPYASVFRAYQPEIREFARLHQEIGVYEKLEDVCREINRLLGVISHRDNPKKYLVVWLGLDSIADLLAEARKDKPASFSALAGKKDSPSNEGFSEPLSKQTGSDPIWDQMEALMEALGEGKNDAVAEEDIQAEEEHEPQEITFQEEEADVYDARQDIARLIHLGPTCNVFNLVIYDSASALRDFREVKTSDFNHKIAFPMSDYEAGEFLDQPRLIRELAGQLGYYHNGRMGRRFIPYKL